VGLLGRALARSLPLVPRPVVRKVASRYIAGEELADALRAVRGLNAAGKLATLDVLGEEVRTEAEAAEIVRGYLEALEAIEHEGLHTGVSVKPTALGLELGSELCRANLETIVRAAAGRGRFVRIDMEDSSTTSATLDLYRELRAAGHDNVGIVLQARLRRTLEDARALAELTPSVRLCKGIYLEPEEVAFQDDREVGERFVEIAETLLDAGCYVAFATHADRLIARSRVLVAERGLAPGDYELQLLLGVRADLADRLVAAGLRVRIYVPYGKRWYEYSLRRLQENPQLAMQVALGPVRRLAKRP
jgi:proline dehydrogenase